jgi:hypothetical protein
MSELQTIRGSHTNASKPCDANDWQPRFLTFHEIPLSTRSHAPSRQPSLILCLVRPSTT